MRRFHVPLPILTLLALLVLGARPPLGEASSESDSSVADTASVAEEDELEGPPEDAIRLKPVNPLARLEGEQTTGPHRVFDDFQRAWLAEDTESLLGLLGRGRVYISLGPGGPFGGSFSPNQAFYLIEDHFDHTVTEHFEIKRTRTVEENGRKVFAIAEREFRWNENGRQYKDKLFISLRREDQRWVISEIKSTL